MPWLRTPHHTLAFKKRPRLLIVGYGDVAKRLVTRYLPKHLNTLTVSRQVLHHPISAQQSVKPRPAVRHIRLDLDLPNATLARICRFSQHIIYLAPPSSADGANSDIRSQGLIRALSKANGCYHQNVRGRQRRYVRHTTRFANRTTHKTALPYQHVLSKRIVYMSTSGVYGDCQGALICESQPLQPQNPRAKRRVAAESLWRKFAKVSQKNITLAFGKKNVHKLNISILRVPGIYAAERLPFERLQQQIPALIVQDDVYTNHIHANDLAKITWLTLWRGRTQRVYHASDDTQLKMADYFDLIANHYGLPKAPRLDRESLKKQVSTMQYSFMTESRRLDNTRLKDELRIKLNYPTVSDFLKGEVNAAKY